MAPSEYRFERLDETKWPGKKCDVCGNPVGPGVRVIRPSESGRGYRTAKFYCDGCASGIGGAAEREPTTKTVTRERSVDALAAAFAAKIREELSPEEVAEIDRLNKERDDSSCATHDFCDANMPMSEAFKAVYGHEVRAHSDADAALWNAAWTKAKRAGFAAKAVA